MTAPAAPLPTLPATPAMHPIFDDFEPEDWDALSSRFTALAGFMSGRRDVSVRIAPGVGRGAPACFIPSLAKIEVNPVACFPQSDIDRLIAADLHPADLDVVRRDHRLITPAATGALGHEAGHAAHSTWILPPETPGATAKAAALIEEPRQEQRYLLSRPFDAVFLRACVMQIVAPGFTSPATPADPVRGRWDAAKAATLLCARADGGLFTDAEVAPVRDQAVAALGQDDYDRLRQVWLDAFDVDDADADAMLALAVRWCKIVGADPEGESPDGDAGSDHCGGMPGEKGEKEPSGSRSGEPTDSEDSDPSEGDGSEGDGGDSADTEPDPLTAAIAAACAAISESAEEAVEEETAEAEAAAAKAAAPTGPSETDARAADTADIKAKEKAAAKVFGHGKGEGPNTSSFTTRQPTGAERNAAADIARELARAKYRDRDRTHVNRALPPGRLQTRQAIQGAALRAQGIRDTSTPWKSTTYARVEDPPITLAIALDRSGSMRWAEKPLSAAAYILAEAVDRVGGKSATVTFGKDVTAVTRPGDRPDLVREFTANADREAAVEAFTALDGALNLTRGTGARIVAVATDGHFVGNGQMAGSAAYVKRLTAAGCVVLWVSFLQPGDTVSGALVPVGAIPIELIDPTTAGTIIGRIAAEALTAASA